MVAAGAPTTPPRSLPDSQPASARTGRSITPTLIAVFALGFAPLAACKDAFPCGDVAPDGRAPRTCDARGQVCVCDEQRCAEQDSACPSGWSYVFEEQADDEDACVEQKHIDSVVDQQKATPDFQFCPPLRPTEEPCGQKRPDGSLIACVAGEVCDCESHSCAKQIALDVCESGWLWSHPLECVSRPSSSTVADDVRIPAPTLFIAPDPILGLCAPPESGCGLPGLGGSPSTCADNTACLCELADGAPVNRCIFSVSAADCPLSGVRFVAGECAPPITGALLADSESGLCFEPPSAETTGTTGASDEAD